MMLSFPVMMNKFAYVLSYRLFLYTVTNTSSVLSVCSKTDVV